MKLVRLTTTLLAGVILTGCSFVHARYEMGLDDVTTGDPASASATKNAMTQQKDRKNNFSYNDDKISVVFTTAMNQMDFVLNNNTSKSLKVIWDDGAFVGPDGVSERILHKGIRFLDKAASMPPTVIPAHGKLDDTIIPADHVHFTEGQYGGWSVANFLPTPILRNKETEKLMAEVLGKNFVILLPIMSGDKTVEYSFKFKINKAALVDNAH